MIAEIERAIASRIKAASNAGVLGYQFNTIAAYADASTDIPTGALDLPAMWVVYDGEEDPKYMGGGHFAYNPVFLVMVAAEEWHSKTFERRKVDSGKPGSYLLMSDVRALLVNQGFGLAIAPLSPGRVNTVKNESNLSVLSMEFHTQYFEEPNWEFDSDIADFLRFHADYDFPVHGNVEPPLPTAEADARDDVNLPGPST